MRDRQTDRQSERQTDRQTDRESERQTDRESERQTCLLYTSDAADDMQCVDLGGRRIIKKLIYVVGYVHVFYMTSVKKFKGSEIKNESGIGPSPRKVR